MNYREKIRKAISCPQFGNETYGEWGALNLEQRKYIKRLLDELDRADNYFKSVYLENQELKNIINQIGFEPDEIAFLQQENKQLKELIDTILNWNIFKNECPMNFGYDEETNENKAQDVFYKDDDYCENNCNDDYTKCWLKYFKRMQELERSDSNE